jgi:glycosyltransferase involved in cell wall biosynthesis
VNGAPRVSVVVPSHGRPQLLRTAVRSALAQTGVDLEVVVVDDGSPEPVGDLGAELGDPCVRVLRRDVPGGVGDARNAGVAAATGEWVAFLDDDDVWAPTKLASQLQAADAAGAAWAFTGAVDFLPWPRAWHGSAAPSVEQVRARLPDENVVPAGASNVVAKREIVLGVGGFDPTIPHLADWDMWLKLLRVGAPAGVDRCLTAYRLHPSNMALVSIDGIHDELEVISERHRDLRGGRAVDPTAFHHWIAVTYWRAGRRAEARAAYLRAFRAGHRRSLLRVLRTYVPVHRIRQQVLRQPDPTWPDGVEEWLVPQVAPEAPT